MEESFAVRDLVPPARVRELLTRSDRRGLVQLLIHATAVAATASLVANARGTVWLSPAMAIYGVALIFLFAALHESIHRTAFRCRWLNDLVAWTCGFVVALPPAYFRYYHFDHHRYTANPERGPELSGPVADTLVAYVLRVSGIPYWHERAGSLVRQASGRVGVPFVPSAAAATVVREARLFLVGYAILAAAVAWADSGALLIYWLGPALLGQPVLRLFLLTEHANCATGPDMLANTRTTISNALIRRLSWNMPYHVEHHLYPGVPFMPCRLCTRRSAPRRAWSRQDTPHFTAG